MAALTLPFDSLDEQTNIITLPSLHTLGLGPSQSPRYVLWGLPSLKHLIQSLGAVEDPDAFPILPANMALGLRILDASHCVDPPLQQIFDGYPQLHTIVVHSSGLIRLDLSGRFPALREVGIEHDIIFGILQTQPLASFRGLLSLFSNRDHFPSIEKIRFLEFDPYSDLESADEWLMWERLIRSRDIRFESKNGEPLDMEAVLSLAPDESDETD